MKIRQSQTNTNFILPDPGDLDKRICLRQRIDQPASDYGTSAVFENIRPVWAKIRQVGATTYHESVQADNIITHFITIRYREGITSDFEVVFSRREFRIKRIRDLNSEQRYLLLECEELGSVNKSGDIYG